MATKKDEATTPEVVAEETKAPAKKAVAKPAPKKAAAAKSKKQQKAEAAANRVRKSKKDIMGDHGDHDKDTGSVPVQVALLSEKISDLTDHLKLHPKDDHSRRGLMRCVSQRRKLLSYLKDKSQETYESLIAKLGLRH